MEMQVVCIYSYCLGTLVQRLLAMASFNLEPCRCRGSISLWRTLQGQLNTDFEMEFTGGLMVAENSDQIKFLEQKSKAEAGVGIETTLIDKDQIAKIVPEISGSIIAGSWCEKKVK